MQMLNLRCPNGDLDITFAPSGFPDGYATLRPAAHTYAVGTVTVHVADLEDIIRSKRPRRDPKILTRSPNSTPAPEPTNARANRRRNRAKTHQRRRQAPPTLRHQSGTSGSATK